jgi:hypothetical protein
VLTGIASAIVVWIDRGRLAFNTREAPALWLEWIGRLADLTTATPMWTREADLPLFRSVAVWIAVLFAAWVLLRIADGTNRLRVGARFSTAAAAVLALAVMTASSLVWTLEGASTRTTVPSQLRLVDAIVSQPRVAAVQLDPWSRLAAADVPAGLRIELMSRPAREAPSTLVAFPPLPAGDYRVTVTPDLPRGWLMVGIVKDARDPFALRTLQLPVGAIDLKFPLPVRGFVVRGDEDARRTIRQVVIEPLRVRRPAERLTSEAARRAVRYGECTVYFLDDRSFPEPDAFWVAGRRASTVVIQPDVSRSSTMLRVRNAPVDNRVTLAVGTWRRDLQMGPGEEQQIEVPLDAARGGAVLRVESASGFRPSEQDPSSRDQRFLGVWIRIDR